jgi:hypothetical protein
MLLATRPHRPADADEQEGAMSGSTDNSTTELHLRRRLKRLWRLGPRPLAELLLETAAISGRRTWLDKRVDDYLAIEPKVLDAAAANDWPSAVPLVVIEGDRR